jgi:predicted AAA+ superfamily ATPase
MKRFITNKLYNWKSSSNRKPLILRGARQTGKTTVIKMFGKQYVDGRIHTVDFENDRTGM